MDQSISYSQRHYNRCYYMISIVVFPNIGLEKTIAAGEFGQRSTISTADSSNSIGDVTVPSCGNTIFVPPRGGAYNLPNLTSTGCWRVWVRNLYSIPEQQPAHPTVSMTVIAAYTNGCLYSTSIPQSELNHCTYTSTLSVGTVRTATTTTAQSHSATNT